MPVDAESESETSGSGEGESSVVCSECGSEEIRLLFPAYSGFKVKAEAGGKIEIDGYDGLIGATYTAKFRDSGPTDEAAWLGRPYKSMSPAETGYFCLECEDWVVPKVVGGDGDEPE